MHVSGQRVGRTISTTRGIVCVGRKELNSWVREEFQLMIALMKYIVKFGHMRSKGDQFAQFLNDCATLKNRHKHMSLRLEMAYPRLKCDLDICLGVVRVKDGADKTGHATINLIFDERVGFKYEQITHATTTDRSEKFIVTTFNHYEDVCNTHGSNKIGK